MSYVTHDWRASLPFYQSQLFHDVQLAYLQTVKPLLMLPLLPRGTTLLRSMNIKKSKTLLTC